VIVCSANHRFPTDGGLLSIDTGLQVGVRLNTTESQPVAFDDEIVSIEELDEQILMDIEVDSEDHLFYANGVLTHNSSVEAQEFDHSHIAGGISKINTADNVFGIFTSNAMRERGVYQLQFLKTRSAAAVGQKVELAYDPITMRITDPPNADTDLKPKSVAALRQDLKKVTSSVGGKEAPKEAQEPASAGAGGGQGDRLLALLEKTRKVSDN
jgi:hypothetical protein